MWKTSDEALMRLPGETGSANSALIDYTYMGEGERSFRKLIDRYKDRKQQGANPPTTRLETIQDWSVKFQWRARVEVFDQEERAKRLRVAQTELETMNKRHIQVAQAFQGKVLLWLKEADNSLSKPQDVATFAKLAVEMERRARGVPTILMELSTMTTDQLLDRYSGLLEALRGEVGDDLTMGEAGNGHDGGSGE